MKILNTQKKTAEVKLGSIGVANPDFRQEIKEVTSFDVIEQNVDKVTVFVSVVKFHDERTADGLKNLFFSPDKLLHFVFDDYVLLYTFQSVKTVSFLIFDEVNLTHLPLSEFTNHI